ncbi:MAG: aspartate/glutamate racemase family protein, partial [Gammaproteobacteria bacterium]
DWNAAGNILADAARALEKGGAECVVICANTMHKCADAVCAAVAIPLIHIADATAAAIKKSPSKKPLLLGTRYTMEHDFYRGRLRDRHGIAVVVPDAATRETVHRIIYEELCRGEIRADSKRAFADIVRRHSAAGADGVIFGCTEIGMLIAESDFNPPCFDTTKLHAAAALHFALAD